MRKQSQLRVRVMTVAAASIAATVVSVPAAQATNDHAVTAELVLQLQGARWTDWLEAILDPDGN